MNESDLITLPLFPLNTVVFPHGRLRLRIFESRYINLVKRSLKNNTDFGIVPMLSSDDDALSKIYAMGTRVSIVDFDQMQDGLLGITVKGHDVFEIQNHWVEDDGLNMATVHSHPIPEDKPVDSHFLPVIQRLKHFFPDIQKECGYETTQFDSAYWVFGRLVELVNVPIEVQAHFLTYDDPVLGLHDLMKILILPDGDRANDNPSEQI